MRNITPKQFRCGMGTCPAVYKLHDGKVAIVGAIDHTVTQKVVKKMNSNEFVVVVDPAILANIIPKK